jgi:hypothetical protein
MHLTLASQWYNADWPEQVCDNEEQKLGKHYMWISDLVAWE